MELMKQQALNFGTEVISDDIESVDFSGEVHTLETRIWRTRARLTL